MVKRQGRSVHVTTVNIRNQRKNRKLIFIYNTVNSFQKKKKKIIFSITFALLLTRLHYSLLQRRVTDRPSFAIRLTMRGIMFDDRDFIVL